MLLLISFTLSAQWYSVVYIPHFSLFIICWWTLRLLPYFGRWNQCYYDIAAVVPLLSCVWLFETSWTAAHQASLSFTISRNLLRLMSIELVMLSNDLILCCPLLLLPSVFPNIRVFFNELALQIMWPKYWSFSFSNSPFNEYSGLISFRMDWLDLLAV